MPQQKQVQVLPKRKWKVVHDIALQIEMDGKHYAKYQLFSLQMIANIIIHKWQIITN